MNRYLRYLFLLSGPRILISGIYFWGVCPFINALFPQEFWNPPHALLLVVAPHRIPRDGGDMVTGLAIFIFGLVAAFVYPWVAGNWPDTAPQVYLGLGTGPAPLPSWLSRPHASHRRSTIHI